MKLKDMHLAARLLLSVCLCFVAHVSYAAPAVLSIVADHSPVAAGEAFSLTVTYDTAMDTSVNPVITYPTPDEDASGFLTATTATWLNATTFKQNYQAQYFSLDATTIDVAVDGAKDSIGTAQVPGFQADVFDAVLFIPAPHVIDMKGAVEPEDVTVYPAGTGRVITTADVGKTVVFLIRYDIATDNDGCFGTVNHLCPNITFTNTGGALLSLTNPTITWQTRTRYQVTYTIADGDEQYDSVNAIIAGGVGRRDDDTNKNTDFQLNGVFSIDTSHPTVSSVASSSPSITGSTPASGLVTLTATYSKAMDTTSTPTFSFPNQNIAGSLTATTGTWTDTTHYAQTFKVSSSGNSAASVDVKVSGALNAHGNLQRASTLASIFSISLPAPPTTTPTTLASLTPLILNIPGVSSFPGAFDTSCCGDLLARVLSQALNLNLSYIGQTATGAVILGGFHGARLAFLVTTVTAGDVRAQGVYAVGDGRYQVVSGGIAVTIVPTLLHLDQLVSLLPTGSTIQMTSNGVLTATIDGVTYVVQPAVDVQSVTNTSGRPLVATASDGLLQFTDVLGNDQILYAAFLEPQTLLADLRTIDSAALSAIQLDGTARTAVFGQTYIVVPDLTLSTSTANRPSQGWTQNGARYFLYLDPQRGNTVQGLSIKTN